MKVKFATIKIREIIKNYTNDGYNGVTAYDGLLNIRPKYQREFIYNNDDIEKLIITIKKGLPIGQIHFFDNGENSNKIRYELMDGQQRITSICKYVNEKSTFGVYDSEFGTNKVFKNLSDNKKNQILNYKLNVYIYTTNDTAELCEWIKTIIKKGIQHNDQEIRTIAYGGKYLTHARHYFTDRIMGASHKNKKIIKGSAERQELLETALQWISEKESSKDNKFTIEDYLSLHQNDENSDELKNYFENIIDWVRKIFPESSSEFESSKEQDSKKSNPNFRFLRGVDKRWGSLYEKFHNTNFDSNKLEEKVNKLLDDDEVQNKTGVFVYVLNGDEKELNYKTFDDKLKRKKYNEQNGICNACYNKFKIDEMEGDHIIPRSKGGKTTEDNCQMLCTRCNRKKYNK